MISFSFSLWVSEMEFLFLFLGLNVVFGDLFGLEFEQVDVLFPVSEVGHLNTRVFFHPIQNCWQSCRSGSWSSVFWGWLRTSWFTFPGIWLCRVVLNFCLHARFECPSVQSNWRCNFSWFQRISAWLHPRSRWGSCSSFIVQECFLSSLFLCLIILFFFLLGFQLFFKFLYLL